MKQFHKSSGGTGGWIEKRGAFASVPKKNALLLASKYFHHKHCNHKTIVIKFHTCKYTSIVIFKCRFFKEQLPSIVSNTVSPLVVESLTVRKRKGAFWLTLDMSFCNFRYYSISCIQCWVAENCNASLMLASIFVDKAIKCIAALFMLAAIVHLKLFHALIDLNLNIYFTAISLA